MQNYFVHVASYVDDNVYIGNGTEIWHFCHIADGAVIGENCSIGHNVVIGKDVHIGHDCTIQSNVSVYEGITLEPEVYIGSGAVFTNSRIPRAKVDKGHQVDNVTTIHIGATIGANATIVCGYDVGPCAMVAAGAVVMSDVPAHALMTGMPAKQVGWVCECGSVLRTGMKCSRCGRQYDLIDGVLKDVTK